MPIRLVMSALVTKTVKEALPHIIYNTPAAILKVLLAEVEFDTWIIVMVKISDGYLILLADNKNTK